MANQLRPEDLECPLSTALAYVGDWWTLLLLHDLFDGYSRFDQFQQNLGISSSILTARLKTLQQNGIVERRRYQTNPPRYAYVLTELGASLRPVIVALAAWGNARREPEQRSMILVDRETGQEVEPVLVDRTTGRPVADEGFVFTAGPAAGEEMRRRYPGGPLSSDAGES